MKQKVSVGAENKTRNTVCFVFILHFPKRKPMLLQSSQRAIILAAHQSVLYEENHDETSLPFFVFTSVYSTLPELYSKRKEQFFFQHGKENSCCCYY